VFENIVLSGILEFKREELAEDGENYIRNITRYY
jgi:hypothetical protein